jgi:hypothetical protein
MYVYSEKNMSNGAQKWVQQPYAVRRGIGKKGKLFKKTSSAKIKEDNNS